MEIDISIATLEKLSPCVGKRQRYTIGVPVEIDHTEQRVGLTPQAVMILVEAGYNVLVERNAGIKSGFTDAEYSDNGAFIVEREEVFDTEIIFKIAPPTIEEIGKMRKQAIVFSFAFTRMQPQDYFTNLIKKKITAVAYDNLQSKNGNLIIMDALCKIVGNACPLIAGEYFSLANDGYIVGSFGGIPPTEIVFLGATKIAEIAAKIFMAMDASIKIFDCSLSRLNDIKQVLGHPVYTSTLYPETLKEAITKADLVIADYFYREKDEYLIDEELVKKMKKGSLIIDVGIAQGTKIETSHPTTLERPFYTKHKVTHYCVPNISARFPRTSSETISNILSPILLELAKGLSVDELLLINKSLYNGIYLYKGILTDNFVGTKYGMNAKKLDILLDFSMS